MQKLFPDSNVEYGLDSFCKLESIGIRDIDCPSYEKEQIDLFRNSITYDNGHYNVRLPWKSELMNKVPSNLKFSIAIAERVYERLCDKGLDQAHEEVFEQQEALGFIEPTENRVPGQIFIPHRPVIKMDGLTTTKIRPVFNCSFKVSGSDPKIATPRRRTATEKTTASDALNLLTANGKQSESENDGHSHESCPTESGLYDPSVFLDPRIGKHGRIEKRSGPPKLLSTHHVAEHAVMSGEKQPRKRSGQGASAVNEQPPPSQPPKELKRQRLARVQQTSVQRHPSPSR